MAYKEKVKQMNIDKHNIDVSYEELNQALDIAENWLIFFKYAHAKSPRKEMYLVAKALTYMCQIYQEDHNF